MNRYEIGKERRATTLKYLSRVQRWVPTPEIAKRLGIPQANQLMGGLYAKRQVERRDTRSRSRVMHEWRIA